MAHSADYAELAEQARRIYAEQLVKGLPALVNTLAESARNLLDKPSEHARFMRRRELVHELQKGAATLLTSPSLHGCGHAVRFALSDPLHAPCLST